MPPKDSKACFKAFKGKIQGCCAGSVLRPKFAKLPSVKHQ